MPTPKITFEDRWKLARTGFSRLDLFGVSCLICEKPIGMVRAYDWMRRQYLSWTGSGYGLDGKMADLFRAHMKDPSTTPECLSWHAKGSYLRNTETVDQQLQKNRYGYLGSLLENPNTPADILQAWARSSSLFADHVKKNPILDMLLLEDPGSHEHWITALRQKEDR